MTPAEFLRQVWPDAGLYCLATPYDKGKGFQHVVVESIDEAVAWIDTKRATNDIYFCMHTLRARTHFNPKKKNADGTLGKTEVRSHPNMKEVRCLFLELDVGDSEGKYPTQQAALEGLEAFITKTGLPRPLTTSSGRGLHVFWPLSHPIPVEQFCREAFKLYQLAMTEDLRIDQSKIVDQSAVLRVPGTLHFKDRQNPRPVTVLWPSPTTETATFLKLLNDAHIKTGLQPRMMKTNSVASGTSKRPKMLKKAPAMPLPVDDVVEEIPPELQVPEGPVIDVQKSFGVPPSLEALLSACPQLKRLADLKGNVPEPEWYMGIVGVAQFVENGRAVVHAMSSGHPQYSEHETDAKLDQWGDKGPTSCVKIAQTCGEKHCGDCKFASSQRNPIWAARHLHVLPTPVARYMVGTEEIHIELTDPPANYSRNAKGHIIQEVSNKDNEIDFVVIVPYDLYPLYRVINTHEKVGNTLWRVKFPTGRVTDIEIPNEYLSNQRALLGLLANHDVFVKNNQARALEEYMVAYIHKLQEKMDAEAQNNHVGWSNDGVNFILPDRVIQPDGTARLATLDSNVREVCKDIRTKGSLDKQVELLRFFNSPHYLPNQFYIMCALGAPLMRFTNQYGAVVNATGASGASKSTTLYAASSLWGHPVRYALNGTATGATALARDNHQTVLSNLPVCVDEITHMEPKQVQALALSISQAGQRKRMDKGGRVIPGPDNVRATLMLSTANTSLHQLLSQNNSSGTAGSMRVFEINFQAQQVHTKTEADAFLRALDANYGHIGPMQATYYTQHQQECETRTHQIMAELDKVAAAAGAERFWVAVAATALVAAEVAYRLGISSYSPTQLYQWVVKQQLPSMRGTVSEEYSTPIALLQDFIMHNAPGIAISTDNNETVLQHDPIGKLVGHRIQHTLYLSKSVFKDYCNARGVSPATMINTLFDLRVVTGKRRRIALCKGTRYELSSVSCFMVNLAHPSMQPEQDGDSSIKFDEADGPAQVVH